MTNRKKTLLDTVKDSYRNLVGAAVLGVAALGAGNAKAAETYDFTARENRSGETTIIDVLGNRVGTIDSVGAPAKGTASIIVQGGKQVIRYTPTVGQRDVPDGFALQYTTGGVPYVAVAKGSINGAPTANDDNETAVQGQPKTFYPLANDVDPTNDAMRIVSVSASVLGNTVAIRDGTELQYTPTNGGLDVLTLEIADVADNRSQSIMVIDTDSLPTLGDIATSVRKRASANIQLNGNDADGDTLTYSLTDLVQESGKSPGTAVIDPTTGLIAYTAPAHKGLVVASTEADDGRGGKVQGTLAIDVTNTAPDGLDVTKQGFEGDSISYSIAELSGAALDADGDEVSIDSIVVPKDVTATIAADGKSVTVQGARGVLGHYDIAVRLTDGDEGYADANAGATFVERNAGDFPNTPTEGGLDDIIDTLPNDPTLATIGGKLLTKSKDGRMAFYSLDSLAFDADKPTMNVKAMLRKRVKGEDHISAKNTRRIVVTYDGKAYMTWDASGNINLADPMAQESHFGLTIKQPTFTVAPLGLISGERGDYVAETPADLKTQMVRYSKSGVPTAMNKMAKNKNVLQHAISWGMNAPSATAPELEITRKSTARKSLMFQPTLADGSTYIPAAQVEGQYESGFQNDLTAIVEDGVSTDASQFDARSGQLVSAIDGVTYERDEYGNQHAKPDTRVTLPQADFSKVVPLAGRNWFAPTPVSASDYTSIFTKIADKVKAMYGATHRPNYMTPTSEPGLAVKKGTVYTAKADFDVNE